MLNLLKQMYRQFSNTEKNIADYLLDNHIYIPNYSIHLQRFLGLLENGLIYLIESLPWK